MDGVFYDEMMNQDHSKDRSVEVNGFYNKYNINSNYFMLVIVNCIVLKNIRVLK